MPAWIRVSFFCRIQRFRLIQTVRIEKIMIQAAEFERSLYWDAQSNFPKKQIIRMVNAGKGSTIRPAIFPSDSDSIERNSANTPPTMIRFWNGAISILTIRENIANWWNDAAIIQVVNIWAENEVINISFSVSRRIFWTLFFRWIAVNPFSIRLFNGGLKIKIPRVAVADNWKPTSKRIFGWNIAIAATDKSNESTPPFSLPMLIPIKAIPPIIPARTIAGFAPVRIV